MSVQLKRNSNAGTVPTAGQLLDGEIAINTADGIAFLKKDDGTIVQIGATAINVPYTGLTGTVPTWNQNTTGNALTATSAGTVTTAAQTAITSVGTLIGLTANAYILSSSGIQAKTASYTLIAADNGTVITMSVATANTFTVPASLPVGFNCTIIQIGAGQTTITASGTTLNSVSSFLKISAQHGSASIISYASNVYNVAGSLSA